MDLTGMNRETRFDYEVARDTLQWHFSDDNCCGPQTPCDLARYHLRRVEEIQAGQRVPSTPHLPAQGQPFSAPRPAAGAPASNQYGTFQVKNATPAQVRFLQTCLDTRDLSGLNRFAMTGVEMARQALAQGTISKKLASNVLDVIANLPVRADLAGAPVRKATDKQIAFATRLLAERDHSAGYTTEDLPRLSAGEVSALIDSLLKLPKLVAASAPADLQSGIYQAGDTVYKVYWNQGKTRMLAKSLTVTGGKGRWEYQGLASRFVRPDQRMTLEQAKQFGAIYGVCCNCGATLTDETSIEAGIGPVCAKRFE